MDHYIDDNFSIVDGILLSCRNGSGQFVIPAAIEGHKIYRIGSGCSINGSTESVIVSEGIREIGREAFLNCSHLKRVELPESLESIEEFGGLGVCYKGFGNVPVELYIRRIFSRSDYDHFLADSIQLSSGEYLLSGDYPEYSQFSHILNSYGSLRPPAGLNADVRSLFILDKDKVRQLCFDGGELLADGEISEHEDFIKRIVPLMIREKSRIFWDNGSELAADKAMQYGEHTFPERVMLTTFRKEETIRRKDKVSVRFRIFFEKVFVPVITAVRYKGQTSYVYSEMYLNCDPERPFVRQTDPGKVFDKKGDRIKQDEVFAKYKLLAMLS